MRDKFLILGSRGLLGTNLKKFFKKKNIKYITYKRNIKTNFQVLKKTILKNKTKVIINLSALADVDLCEKNKSRANEINYIFVKKLCEIVTEIKDLHIIHISTDQIYSKFSKNYENKFKAINYYSKTKILAEKELKKVSATIFRTNFFGLGNHKAKMSFSDWIFNNLKKKNYFEMADDIYFSPIRIETLCELIYKACKLKISGIYNVGSKKAFSKYSFAIKFAFFLQLDNSRIVRVKKKQLNFYAKRPSDMRMQVTKFENFFNLTLPFLEDEIRIESKNYLNAK